MRASRSADMPTACGLAFGRPCESAGDATASAVARISHLCRIVVPPDASCGRGVFGRCAKAICWFSDCNARAARVQFRSVSRGAVGGSKDGPMSKTGDMQY